MTSTLNRFVSLLLLALALVVQCVKLDAQGTGRQADCFLPFRFSGTGTSAVFDNRTTVCNQWTLTYSASGFSALSIQVDGAPDNLGVAGTFASVMGPKTTTTSDTTGRVATINAWMRVRVTSATLSLSRGVIQGALYGYRNSATSGGSSSATFAGATVYPLSDGDFSWVNQGGATYTNTNGIGELIAPVEGGFNVRMRCQSVSGNYRLDALVSYMQNFHVTTQGGGEQRMGVGFRDSATGRMSVTGYRTNGSELAINERFANATTYGFFAHTVFSASGSWFPRIQMFSALPTWVHLLQDGTNQKWGYSPDGLNPIYFVSEATGTYTANPNQLCFYVECEGCVGTGVLATGNRIRIYSWKVTAL